MFEPCSACAVVLHMAWNCLNIISFQPVLYS